MSGSLRTVATTPSRQAALKFVLLIGNRCHPEADPPRKCFGPSNRALTPGRETV